MNLTEINARLKKTSIKGRDYVEVNQRILAFWELFPDGRIITEKLSDDGERCDFKAKIKLLDPNTGKWRTVATGHAFELKSAGMVNKTSYVENAETSAVGRALGMLGIGATESIASADEVKNAIAQQQQPAHDDELKAAQEYFKRAAQAYCEKFDYGDWVEFFKNQILTRSDYNNDSETLIRIADELLSEV